MTREEKINTLKAIIQECEEYEWQRKETLFEIIKDLEQETVFDKLRAEIEMEKLEDSPNFCVKAHNNAVDRVLGIIDKCKAEGENKE